MKVSLDTLAKILGETAPEKAKEIIQKAEKAIQEEKETREPRAKKAKNQYAVVQTEDKQVSYVVQVGDTFDLGQLVPTIYKAIGVYNGTKRGGKFPIKSIGDAFFYLKPKITKELGFKIITKESVQNIDVKNEVIL